MGYDLAKGPTVHRRGAVLELCSLSAFNAERSPGEPQIRLLS